MRFCSENWKLVILCNIFVLWNVLNEKSRMDKFLGKFCSIYSSQKKFNGLCNFKETLPNAHGFLVRREQTKISKHTVVFKVEGTAVGFMSVCTDVNVDLLNECFELGPFHGLHKQHADDELEAPRTPSPPVQATPRLGINFLKFILFIHFSFEKLCSCLHYYG